MEAINQTQAIKAHLESGRSITPIDALRQYGCMRLGARIFDLRREGMAVSMRLVKHGKKRYAEYYCEN